MRFGPRPALLCTLLLAAALPVVVVGQLAAGPAAAAPVATQSDNVTLPPDSMTIAIELQRSGDARWVVTTEFVLENESDRRAFQQLVDEFESAGGDATAYDFGTFERAAAAGREATGREMTVEQPRYDGTTTDVDNATVGRLTLTFRWTNFTETSGERLQVGDAFNSSDGTWFPGLTNRQTLVIRPPPGYSVDTAPVPVRNGVLRWEGPTTFEPGYLGQITYERTAPGTSPGSPPEGTPTPSDFDLSTLGLVGIIVIGLGTLAIGAYVVSRRSGKEPSPVAEPNANGGVDEAVESGAGAAGAGAEAADEPDFELLSDEERVEYLLEQNGGRMKQANIVKETGWSNAKVSQLLSAMDEDDRIDKLRIGRENLISLPDEEVGEFDEE